MVHAVARRAPAVHARVDKERMSFRLQQLQHFQPQRRARPPARRTAGAAAARLGRGGFAVGGSLLFLLRSTRVPVFSAMAGAFRYADAPMRRCA